VVLQRADGHALVANSLALQRAGIDRNTAAPSGGAILKDAAGEPTGMLVDNAMALVERLVPPPTEADAVQALEVGAWRSVQVGWTQLQIAGNTFQEVDRLCRLYAAGKIQLRLYDAIYGPSADADRLLAAGPDPQHCGGKLAVRGIKLYIDGAFGSRGAALLKPYSDSSGSRGLFCARTVGPERLAGAYAWQPLLASGAIVAGGSDAPVEQGDPRVEFYAAVSRRSEQGFAAANWHRELRVSRAQALKMFSLAPAYAAFQEQDRGSIEVGKLADFTVLSPDIMTIPEAQILTSHVVMTIIGGEVVYSRSPP
jgi:predicted amidohydrolase YtcJ